MEMELNLNTITAQARQAVLELLEADGLRPRGLLWYQGEAEGYEKAADTYLERFARFVRRLREDLESPGLPVLTAQLNRCMTPCDTDLDRQWGMVRQAQREAARRLENVWVVPAIDLPLYDFLHNSAQGNLVLGVRMAPERVPRRVQRVCNWLNPFDVAPALLPFEAEDGEGLVRPSACQTRRDTMELTFPRPLGEGAVVHGAWRCDPGPCIPCDCMRMPMLAFYGLPISER